MHMNWFDYLLIALVAVSLIAGAMRGLLREVIAFITWVVGVWIAFHYAPLLEPKLGGLLTSDALRPWAARLVIFLVVFLVGTIVGSVIAHFVRLSMFSGTDRFWGAIFGLLRGFVVVGAFVILCQGLRLEGETWWRGSLLVPYAEHVANVLRQLIGERKIDVDRLHTFSK
jgi:membrane protein required for colicin V production